VKKAWLVLVGLLLLALFLGLCVADWNAGV